MPSGGLQFEPRILDTISETASADTPVARAPPPPTGGASAEGPTSAGESPHGQGSRFSGTLLQLSLFHLFLRAETN